MTQTIMTNSYIHQNIAPKKMGNPKQVGVYERLTSMGVKNPVAVIREMLKIKKLSELASIIGVALSTLSRFCERQGLRAIKRHPKKQHSENFELLDLPPARNNFFKCGKCEDYIPTELRGHTITSFCMRCERRERLARV